MNNTQFRKSTILFALDDDQLFDFVENQIKPGSIQQSPHHNATLINYTQITNSDPLPIQPDPIIMASFSKFIKDNIQQTVQNRQKIPNKGNERLINQLKKCHLDLQVLEGEVFVNLSDCQLYSQKRSQAGQFILTNYRFVFYVNRRKKLQIPLGYIQRISLKSQKKQGTIIQVILKYSPIWKFKYKNKTQAELIQNFLNSYIFPTKISDYFAFSHAKYHITKHKTFHYYTFDKQYTRIGFPQNPKFKKIQNNARICDTYPNHIWVPHQTTDNMIRIVAKARQRQRVPVATYLYKNNKNITTCLWRSSQLRNPNERSMIDMDYITSLSYYNQLLIVDPRNKSVSKLQNSQFYKHSEVICLDLDPTINIKDAYHKMIQACLSVQNKKFLKGIIQSRWYQQIRNLLEGASLIAKKLTQGRNILVHCADGWDRTSQLCALSMLILDPYYRTLEGFPVLIQKQFSSFGQPYHLRIGSKGGSQNQIPVVIQFLDSVSQMIAQYPLSFQFTAKYLSTLSNLMYTNRYGNFLTGSQQEFARQKIAEYTLSVWHDLVLNPLCTNPLYCKQIGPKQLSLKLSLKNMRFWKQNFLILTLPLKDTYKLHPFAEQNHDYIYLQHSKLQIQANMLQRQIQNQNKLISQLTAQINQFNKKQI